MIDYARDGVTVSTCLDKRHIRKDKTYPVKIRVTAARLQRYYPTGKSLTVKDWESLSKTRSPTLSAIRQDIFSSFEIIKSIVCEMLDKNSFSFTSLDDKLNKSPSETLNDFLCDKIEYFRENKKVATRQLYEYTLRTVIDFKGNKIAISSVNVEWLRNFQNWLLKKGISQGTIRMHLSNIRTVMNIAKEKELISFKDFPFSRNKFLIRGCMGRKKAISLEDIRKIEKYKCRSLGEEKYRDFWLFLFYANGINPIDMLTITYKDIVNDELHFIRTKTRETSGIAKEIIVPVTEPIQRIIKKWGNLNKPNNYIFPILSRFDTDQEEIKKKKDNFCNRMGKHMKKVCTALDVPAVSAQAARHSYASNMKYLGASIEYISESLGHSDIRTTRHYLASFKADIRKEQATKLLNATLGNQC